VEVGLAVVGEELEVGGVRVFCLVMVVEGRAVGLVVVEVVMVEPERCSTRAR
jgi:hypothetical protein